MRLIIEKLKNKPTVIISGTRKIWGGQSRYRHGGTAGIADIYGEADDLVIGTNTSIIDANRKADNSSIKIKGVTGIDSKRR